MAKKNEKTNVMRLLDQAKIAYIPHFYDGEGGKLDGVSVAKLLCEPVNRVYKTLVCRGASGKYCVFVIPVAEELDLKAAAKAAKEKSVAMIPQKELLPLTGYLHGGCSPIGMKKPFATWIDHTALADTRMMMSAGKIGAQVELDPHALIAFIGAGTADLTKKGVGE